MKEYANAMCEAIVNGHRCGKPASQHGVERRHIWNPKPVGHTFIIALFSQTVKKESV